MLSVAPMSSQDYAYISPLGGLNPPTHVFPTSHVSFVLPVTAGAPGSGPFGDGRLFPQQPVVAPADGVLVKIDAYEVVRGTEISLEYDLTVAVCEKQYVRLGHVAPLSQRVIAFALSTVPVCSSHETGGTAIARCEYIGSMLVQSGEELGKTSGQAASFDLSAWDPTTRRSGFAKPQLYVDEAANSYCPLDLFTDKLKSSLFSRLADAGGTKPPSGWCGRLNYDVPGTLQGNWFKDATQLTVEDGNISFGFDSIFPTKPVISNGNSLTGLPAGVYTFDPGSDGWANPAFNEVPAGSNVYCYSGLRSASSGAAVSVTLYVRVVNNGEVLIDTAPGSSCSPSIPWQLSGGAVTFKR